MKDIYEALDNNGKLLFLTVDRDDAIAGADSHYKDAASYPIEHDWHPSDTPVYATDGKQVGLLRDFG